MLNKEEIVKLLSEEATQEELFQKADSIRKQYVGDEVHLRGLIEFSNICRNNCTDTDCNDILNTVNE